MWTALYCLALKPGITVHACPVCVPGLQNCEWQQWSCYVLFKQEGNFCRNVMKLSNGQWIARPTVLPKHALNLHVFFCVSHLSLSLGMFKFSTWRLWCEQGGNCCTYPSTPPPPHTHTHTHTRRLIARASVVQVTCFSELCHSLDTVAELYAVMAWDVSPHISLGWTNQGVRWAGLQVRMGEMI